MLLHDYHVHGCVATARYLPSSTTPLLPCHFCGTRPTVIHNQFTLLDHLRRHAILPESCACE